MGKQKCCLNVDFFVSVTNQYDEVIITTAWYCTETETTKYLFQGGVSYKKNNNWLGKNDIYRFWTLKHWL